MLLIICIFWKNGYSDPLSMFNFFMIEFSEFFTYPRYRFLELSLAPLQMWDSPLVVIFAIFANHISDM